MAINVSSKQDLKNKISETVNLVGDTVGATLGPGGRPVLITDEYGNIRITKDGVSVAKAMTSLQDPVKDRILQIIKTTSQQTVDKVGDGSTSVMILTQAIINEGLKAIEVGCNAVEVQRGIQKATAAVVDELKKMAVDVITEDQIKAVAKLSANGDDEVANLIASALDFAKEDGIVIIEESKSGESSLEFVEGMLIERGMVSPYFVTNEQRAEAVYKDPFILLFDGVIHSATQILGLLNYVANEERPILLFADSFEGEALSLLIVNKMKGIIKPVAVKSPEFGDRRVAYLEDIAVSTGAQVISIKKGLTLEKITDWQNYLGSCRTITVTGKDTTLVDGKYKTTVDVDGVEINPVEERLKDIKSQLDNNKTSAFEKQTLQERISKLTGGVAIIHVGGKSEVEMKEKKDRVDDALHATKAALAEGVVPGGGMALIRCEEALNNLFLPLGDQQVGREIIRVALFAPFKKILSNAGVSDYKNILARIKGGFTKVPHKWFGKEFYSIFSTKWVVPEFAAESVWNGYNVKTEQFVNLQDAGVIDPAKVTRTALENASSVAATILTTTAAVYEIQDDKTYNAEEVKDMM